MTDKSVRVRRGLIKGNELGLIAWLSIEQINGMENGRGCSTPNKTHTDETDNRQ